MDQTQTPRYVSRIEPPLYVPAFTQKDFHCVHIGPPTQETSTEEFPSTNLGLHNSSLQYNHLYTRGKAQSQNNNHTRGIKVQSQTPSQSPILKRENHKPKAKKDYNSWWSQRSQTTLGDLNRPQTNFLTKIRSYR